jgi:amino acid transporter
LALAIALNPGYDPPEWHYYLVYCAWSVALFTVNLPRIFKVLPHLLTAGVVVINATGIYLLIALLVRATPKPTAHQVFVEVVNESGWPSNGVVFFLALLPGMGTVNAFDSITHITDELDNPTKQVPQVMIGYGILASVTGFVMVIVYSFAIVNPLALYDPYGHQPLVQLIFDALRSTALSVIGCLGLILSLFLAGTAALTSWNRLHWSFAREGGLPFSRSMSRLTSTDAVPVNALIADLLLMIAMGAIQIGSLTALNAILGAAVTCGMISYALTFGLALWRGREFLSKDRWLNLGRFGTVLQVTTLLWCVFISIWLCFPLFLPVTLVYMNWTSLVLGCVVVLSTLYWFAFRKTIVHI